MKCDVCKQREATAHVKTVRNGVLKEQNLCPHCAHEMGFATIQSGFDISDFLGSLFGGDAQRTEKKICEKCGTDFAQISRSGKIGCAQCYKTFRQELVPMIQRIHGTTQHKGKSPGRYALRITKKAETEMIPSDQFLLEQKKQQLQKAIAEQKFEKAAELRDEIKELGKHDKPNEMV